MIKFISLVNISLAAMAQSVERRIGSAEVTGPIPVSSLKQQSSMSSAVFLYLHLMEESCYV